MRKERPQHSSLRLPTRMDAFIGRIRLLTDERQDEIVMTRHRISTTATSFLALIAAATVSSGAAAQNPYGRAPAQNPYGAVQNLFGAPPAQTPYGAPQAQNPYGVPPTQTPYGVPPTQTPYGAPPAQNPYGAPTAQTPSGAQAQNVYVYPSQGQSQEQLARDRYECQNWAAGETGFDPARSPAPGAAASPPAANDLSGAAIQALGGTGGVGGAAASALRQYQQGNAGAAQSQQTQHAAQMDGYKRAQTACLQGRGYTVN